MKTYFDRHLFKPIRLHANPESDVSLIIVIPCFNEPDVLSTLHSLNKCAPAKGKIEVIVVINAAENSPHGVFVQNKDTFRQIMSWQENEKPAFRVLVLRDEDLPPKHAGVGLARKIGMDEAAWRFESIGKKEGVIVCLDADSTVAPNYLEAIEGYFNQHPSTKAASIYFEHPLNIEDKILREGIINYELHLRYYRQALKYAGYPYHYHTIGSSMCVRSDVYQNAGGMNRRKAGEDFYFLHKIMPLGNFGEINTTAVYPSARISERVPFGTGRAMKEWGNGEKEFSTYNFKIFEELKVFVEKIPSLFRMREREISALLNDLPISVSAYLTTNDFLLKVEEVNEHTSSSEAFINRFLKWFDGFNVLKLVHHARDKFYPNIAIEDAAKKIFVQIGNPKPLQGEGLLDAYRKLDKSG